MGIKNRVRKLEAKKNPELLNVILLMPTCIKPLPEPVVMGSVRVIHRYDNRFDDDDDPKDKATL
jgi:hypothetical protein